MADGMLRIMCPNLKCRRILGVPPTARGKTVRCGNCRANIRIPANPAPRPEAAPAPADNAPAS